MCLFGRRTAQQDCEFLTAQADREVTIPDARLQQLGKASQNLVTGRVAVLVVNALEVIEVEQRKAADRAAAADRREPVGERHVERSTIAEPGQNR